MIYSDVFIDVTKLAKKLPTSDYRKTGKYPIIDQGQKQIAGYTDLEEGLFTDVPAIIFGDHTRVIKYVDTPFFIGADGVKVIKSLDENADYKYLYYLLSSVRIPNTGYNRHYKWLKEAILPEHNKQQQKQIVKTLTVLDDLIDKYNAQTIKLDKLIKSRFVEMFGDNAPKYDTIQLRDCCDEITGGGTPSMKHPEYYGGDIPFIKSGDVKEDKISKGALTLTDIALKEANAKLLPKNTIIVVVRSAALLREFHIAVADNPIVINQDLKAIKPTEQFIPIYLMWAIKMKKQIILSKIQTMLTSHIRMDDFLALDIPNSPLELQTQFADFVTKVEQQKATVQKSINRLETLKKSLMQEYFG